MIMIFGVPGPLLFGQLLLGLINGAFYALLSLGLMLNIGTNELPGDVAEIGTHRFAIPLHVDADRKDEIDRVRLFVSTDQGKTWKHTLYVNNQTGVPLELKVGDKLTTLKPGEIMGFKLPVGTRITSNTATDHLRVGDVVVEVTSAMYSDSTITINK